MPERSRREPAGARRRRTGVRHRLVLLIVVCGALTALACGDDDGAQIDTGGVSTVPAASDPSTTTSYPTAGVAAAELEGRTFVATSITEDGVERQLVAGYELRVGLARGQLVADVGCNTMGGEYALDGHTLTIRDVSTEEMECPSPRDDQDAWLVEVLGRSLTVALHGDELTLRADALEMRLVAVPPPPDVELVGTRWALDTLIDGDAFSLVQDDEVEAGVTFGTDGIYRLDTGCNTGGALYTESGTATGSTITVQEPRLTRRGCDGAAGEVEAAMGAVFNGELAVEVEGDRLTLTNGGRGLGFTAEH